MAEKNITRSARLDVPITALPFGKPLFATVYGRIQSFGQRLFAAASCIIRPFGNPPFATASHRTSGVATLLLTTFLMTGCGSCEREEADPGLSETRISGTVTVDEALDDTRDYSGITLLVRGGSAGPDTVFHAVTDFDGHFDGTARFPRQDFYQLRIHRSDRRIADTTIVLAAGDTIQVEGSLPRFAGRAQIRSTEHEALQTLNRLDRQYGRMLAHASVGNVDEDFFPDMLDQWSDIYWEVFERWPGTLAGREAADESLRKIEERNDEELMRRLREYGDHEWVRQLASRYGFLAKIRQEGLDAAIVWSDSLEAESTTQETRRRIAMNRIEVLYDSARTDQARNRVHDFEDAFGDDMEVENWLTAMQYDIEHLSAGEPLPSFELELQFNGDRNTIGLEDLAGSPAVIEVVGLTDREYQFTFNELLMAHRIFNDEGIQFLTIPVEENPITVGAFYEERDQDWPVARAGAYAESDLEERWNVFELPVRIVIDSDGRIVRKLHGSSINELISELNKLLINNGEVL